VGTASSVTGDRAFRWIFGVSPWELFYWPTLPGGSVSRASVIRNAIAPSASYGHADVGGGNLHAARLSYFFVNGQPSGAITDLHASAGVTWRSTWAADYRSPFVVGSGIVPDGQSTRAFRLHEVNKEFSDLGSLGWDPALGEQASVESVNASGDIVGYSRIPVLRERAAALWVSGVIGDLNGLIPSDSGWYLMKANDINDRGDIVGYGWFGDRIHAFLLTPEAEAAAPLTLPFADGFESGSEWLGRDGFELTSDDAHSGSRSFRASGDWPATLTLDQEVDLAGAANPELRFWQRRAPAGPAAAIGSVLVSADEGVTWESLALTSGAAADWTEARCSLASYAGRQIRVRFRKTPSDEGGAEPGSSWFIDAVQVAEGVSAPKIVSTPAGTAALGKPYSYDVESTGSPAPTYSLSGAPAGMTIDGASGLIQWTPTAGSPAKATFTVRAENPAGADVQSVRVVLQSAGPLVATMYPPQQRGRHLLLKALVDPNGSRTTVRFSYIRRAGRTTRTAAIVVRPGAPRLVSKTIEELSCRNLASPLVTVTARNSKGDHYQSITCSP
jgi:hypothetical protein